MSSSNLDQATRAIGESYQRFTELVGRYSQSETAALLVVAGEIRSVISELREMRLELLTIASELENIKELKKREQT